MKRIPGDRSGKSWIAARVLAVLGFLGETGLGMIYRPVKSRSLWDVWVLHHEGSITFSTFRLLVVTAMVSAWPLRSMESTGTKMGEVIVQTDDAVWCGEVANF